MKTLKALLISLLLVTAGQAGTVTGVVQNAASGPVANGTFSFTLTQAAVVSGTATVVATSVPCYTDQNGNVVGEPNPSTLPTLSSNLGAGTLGAATYFVKVTFSDATGQTFPGPEGSFALTGTGTLIVQVPTTNQPAGVTSFSVYISTTTGTETLQGSVNVTPGSWGSFSQSTPLVVGAALPASNTTACKLRFNDELQPSFTGYNVALTASNGQPVSGYPQLWFLSGGSAGTINLSLGTPLYSGAYTVIYPQAIVSNPAANGSQSISGPLNLGSFGLTAGPGTFSGPVTAGTGVFSGPDPWVDITSPGYGAVCDSTTDNRAAIQSAVNALAANGTLFIPPCASGNAFRVKSAVLLPLNKQITIQWAGNIQVDFDASGGNNTAVWRSSAQGAFSITTTLTANANPGDQQISVTATTGFAAGQYAIIYDNTGLTGNNCTSYPNPNPNETAVTSCNLEIAQIVSVGAGVLNLQVGLTNTYTTAGTATVAVVQPTFLTVNGQGGSFTHGPDCAVPNACLTDAFDLFTPVNTRISGVTFNMGKAPCTIQSHRGFDVEISHNTFIGADNSITGSGLNGVPSCFDEATSHSRAISNHIFKEGQWNIADLQSHHILIEGNDIHGFGDSCANVHGKKDFYITFKGNVCENLSASSASATIQAWGFTVNDTDHDVDIEGNTFTNWGGRCISLVAASAGSIFNITDRNNKCINPISSTGTFPPNYLSATAGVQFCRVFTLVDRVVSDGGICKGSFSTSSIVEEWEGVTNAVISNRIIQQLNGAATGDVGLRVLSTTGFNTSNVIVQNMIVTGFHGQDCLFDQNAAGTYSNLIVAHNNCSGGGTPYQFSGTISNLVRFNNQGDTPNNLLAGFVIPEAAAVAGLASNDVLYPDSTAHRWKANNNNGGPVTFPYLEVAQTFSAVQHLGSNVVQLTADATPISATTPGTTFLTFGALPVSTNFSFNCHILYNQQTAAGGVGLAVQGATNAPARLDAWANVFTSNAGVAAEGSAANITTTTATSVVSATPSVITTVFQADLNGTIQVGASASTLNILMFTGNASDTVTPKAGSYCTLY